MGHLRLVVFHNEGGQPFVVAAIISFINRSQQMDRLANPIQRFD
ncbi:MAG: hypothetical protein WBY88_14335 [Desulfosarcina sp.]